MSDKDLKSFIAKIEEGLAESRKKLLNEYALHDDSLVESDNEGNIVHVPARDILGHHPELRL